MFILRRTNKSHLRLQNKTNILQKLPVSSSLSPIETENSNDVEQTQNREDYWNPPPDMVKLPWYRRMKQFSFDDCEYEWLRKEAMSESYISVGNRLNDYYKMQQIVNWLPTIKEKIDFVNPYEREWRVPEKKWHRPWMQPLVQPRKAWNVPVVPTYFDSLNFYKFITKCRLVEDNEATEELEENYYKSLKFPTSKLENRVSDSLSFWLDEEHSAEIENYSSEERTQNLAKFLRSIVEDAHLILGHNNTKLLNHRISHNPRCESFWIRAGFQSLYEHLPIWETEKEAYKPPYPKRKMRFTGDDRRRLGELSFTMRDNHLIQVRQTMPMKNLFPMSESELVHAPMFPDEFNVTEELIFSPKVYNIKQDAGILWQCPGFEYDSNETHLYGRLAIKDVRPLIETVGQKWRPDSREERNQMISECVKATAIVSLFNWLNGQAHCLGHTQYTEIQEPLTSQMILSDGIHFWFAVAQLNTLAINIEIEGFNNRRTNCCFVEGPYQLFDSFNRSKTGFYQFKHKEGIQIAEENKNWICSEKGRKEEKSGLNPKILERILQMIVV